MFQALMVVGLGGGILYALTRKSPSPQPVIGTSGLGLLSQGESYRIIVRARTRDDASHGLTRAGFDIRSLDKDPSTVGVFSALGVWTKGANHIDPIPGVVVLRLDRTEALPSASEVRVPPTQSLDHGLTVRELEALRHALAEETNPKHLGGFASTFEPDFPIAASLLRAKEALIKRRSIGSVHQAADRKRRAERVSKAPELARHPFEGFAPFKGDVPPFWEEFGDVVSREVSPHAVWLKGRVDDRLPKVLSPREEAAGKVRALIVLFLRDPGLLRKTPAEIARAYKVSEAIANHALMAVNEWSDDLRLVDPRYGRLLPPAPRPSPGALHLASAAIKPTLSPVSDVDTSIKLARETFRRAERGDPKAVKAKLTLGRATKAIDRERWIRWYDRKRKL